MSEQQRVGGRGGESPSSRKRHSKRVGEVSGGVFVVSLLLIAALFIDAIGARFESVRQRNALFASLGEQRPALEQAKTLRNQLESIARATADLADQGNSNALLIRAQLKEQGIDISPGN